MDTLTIKRQFRKIAKDYRKRYGKKLFHRVCACDKLPRKVPLNQDAIIIFNTHPSSHPGEHWCAIFIQKGNKNSRVAYYFDSYGLEPNNKFAIDFIKRNSTQSLWNNIRLQSNYSYCCGEFSIMFCETMIYNKSANCFFNQFSRKLVKNDEKVRALYNCKFNSERECSQTCRSYISCLSRASKQEEEENMMDADQA